MSASSITNIVLITGANQGLGFEIAKTLSAMPGYHVLVGSRDAQRGAQAASLLQERGLHAESITIDVTSDDSIASAAETVATKFGRLDVLINNAGVSMKEDGLPTSALRNVYQDMFSVNTFGAALTTEAFVPLLSKAHNPRIVFMSSTVGSLGRRKAGPLFLPVYQSSKTALNMLMLHYSVMFEDKGWKINACCPGHCATNLNDFQGSNTVESGAINAVRLATLGVDGETGTFSDKEGSVPW